jgi:hypothetical protein
VPAQAAVKIQNALLLAIFLVYHLLVPQIETGNAAEKVLEYAHY